MPSTSAGEGVDLGEGVGASVASAVGVAVGGTHWIGVATAVSLGGTVTVTGVAGPAPSQDARSIVRITLTEKTIRQSIDTFSLLAVIATRLLARQVGDVALD
jgi:hypothetical protein